MEISTAKEEDIPEIVSLLKISLGESLLPKSEAYWRWKHIENPFGVSPVLLFRDNHKIVGVRAFMKWQWIKEGKIYKAVRAVDTATHPDYQGKGIFKKLTLALLDFCEQHGDQFVFNTPNSQSKPGYLKMGWKEVGPLPIVLSVQRPFSIIKNILKKSGPADYQDPSNTLSRWLNHPGLSGLIEANGNISNLKTHTTVQYLRWRYNDVPIANYFAIGDEVGGSLTGLIIGRIKKTRVGRELRITDHLSGGEINKNLLDQLADLKKIHKIDYTTVSGTVGTERKRIVGKLQWKALVGPVVTIRQIKLEDLSILGNFNNWSPSLGDLELF